MAPGTFAALGILLKSGRDFNDGDTFDKRFVAVVNEALVRKSIPGQSPIRRTIFCPFDVSPAMTIIGVVGDVRQFGPARERSPDVPLKFTTMEALISENVAAPRFRTFLFGLFAGIAVCLAMACVYGAMAYAMGQRSSEIGLRIALGAAPGLVLRQVLRQGLVLVGIGLMLGLAGAAATARMLASMLFQVRPNDFSIYLGVAVLLGALALVASYVPARRASRIDPLEALRQE